MAEPASADAIVRVSALGKRYQIQRGWKDTLLHPSKRDVRVALDGIDLSVSKGECFGVLGENGAGKSTLFKILATLVRPDSGSASVGGVDVLEDPARVREILTPVIPAERSLYWRVSAEENLRLYATLYGLSAATAKQRVREVMEIVGLEEVGRKQVGLFSSGMKQRLLIGRALLGRPRVLLLDEPTRSLDPLSARDFRAFLRSQILGAQQTTVLLATHDHEEVTELCDRVAVLDRGRLLAIGKTETLLSSSRSRMCSIWTSDAASPALESCVHDAGARVVSVDPVEIEDESGWHRVRIEISTDEAGAAELLASIASAGIPVSRFTRDDLSLADLIERVKSEHTVHPVAQPA